jgi:uncharacterized protein YkwD
MIKKWWYIVLIISIICSFIFGEDANRHLMLNDRVENLNFLTHLEKEVVKELNLARTDPAAYAKYIEEFKKHYVGKYIYFGGETQIATQEGLPAVNEAIAYLKSVKPAPPLRVSRGLSSAAKVHVNDQGSTGIMDHQGTDKSTPLERMNRFGTAKKAFGEIIEYGNWTARRIVMSLIINDGVPDRSHRENIFKPEFGVVGVSFGSHRSYTYMCVIDFAGIYIEGDEYFLVSLLLPSLSFIINKMAVRAVTADIQ